MLIVLPELIFLSTIEPLPVIVTCSLPTSPLTVNVPEPTTVVESYVRVPEVFTAF